MNWLPLNQEAQIPEIKNRSFQAVDAVAIFKHSTRCHISSMAKKRLEHEWDLPEDRLPVYYLDLIAFRNISNKIADEFAVHHESPQILLIKDGKCIYDASHGEITAAGIKAALTRGEQPQSAQSI